MSDVKNEKQDVNQSETFVLKQEGAKDLQTYLRIQPPEDAAKTSPILSFERKREINISWKDILVNSENIPGGQPAAAAIRAYFEKSWRMPGGVTKDWVESTSAPLLTTATASGRITQISKPGTVIRIKRDSKDILTVEGVAEGFTIEHGSGRLYLLVTNTDSKLVPEDFKTFKAYEEAWDKKIQGVELVSSDVKNGTISCMEFEEIDLRPPYIQRQYDKLKLQSNFAGEVKTKVMAITTELINKSVQKELSTDEIEQLQRKILRLEMNALDVERRIQRLASTAARLGFLLCLKADKKTIAGKEKTFEVGKIYNRFTRTAQWIQYVPVQVTEQVGWWVFRHTRTRTIEIPQPIEKVVEDYTEIDTSIDILEAKRAALNAQHMQVFVFKQSPAGLISEEGVPLRQIVDRCDYDEAFRKNCVVMLPVYEESLTGSRLIAKYSIYKRPLPGVVPTILPRLSFVETLSYRTAWVQTQLGEMVSSINLAPEEERKITISKEFKQETAVTQSSSSIFDINRTETTDLATEMENQSRREQDSSKSMQFSTKASGGWGPFSAEASASGGVSSSLKDMNQAISKVARKAAQSVSSHNKQEVSASSSTRTTVTNSDQTVATIRNINQGRSLNLMFYRLYNKYKGGLFLEGLRFDIIPSIEVIAGSGVHESRSHGLRELATVLDEFTATHLPFPIQNGQAYTDKLIGSINELLSSEYSIHSDVPVTGEEQHNLPTIGRLRLPERLAFSAGDKPDVVLAKLKEALQYAIVEHGVAIEQQELLVASQGLYLDAMVGEQPCTEPYSESMRELQKRLRAAEVAVKESESIYQRAMAMRLAQMMPVGGTNRLLGILPGFDNRSLILSLRLPLLDSDWRLLLDGKEVLKIEKTDLGRLHLVFNWAQSQDWIGDENLRSRLSLVDSSGETITFAT